MQEMCKTHREWQVGMLGLVRMQCLLLYQMWACTYATLPLSDQRHDQSLSSTSAVRHNRAQQPQLIIGTNSTALSIISFDPLSIIYQLLRSQLTQ